MEMENKIVGSRAPGADFHLADAVVATDADGVIYWTNRAFRRLCGYSKNEVFGRRPDEFLQGENTDPETLRAIRAAIQKGKPLSVEVLNYHKLGRPYWVSIELNPTKTGGGRLTGFIAIEHELMVQQGEIFGSRSVDQGGASCLPPKRNRVFSESIDEL